MPEVLLILEFKRDRLDCAIFNATGAKQPDKISAPYGSDAAQSVAAIAAQLKDKGAMAISAALVSLPSGAISQRVLELPFDDKAKLDEIVGFEAGESFLGGTDGNILQAMPMADGRALVAAANKDTLRSILSAMKAAGIDPVWVGASLFSKHKLLSRLVVDPGQVVALIDASSITIVKGVQPRFFKEIIGQDELALAMLALKADGIVPSIVYATKGAFSLAASLGTEVRVIDEATDDDSGIAAMAMHYLSGFSDAINFRTGEFSHIGGAKSARRELTVAAILCAILVIIWGGNSYLRARSYDESGGRIKSAMDAAYKDIFKGEAKVVDPVYQLEVKLKELRDERKMLSGGISALEMMRELSQIELKGAKVRLHQVSFRAGGMSAKGETTGINGANEFKDAVARLPYFKDIVLTDVKSSASGGVVFNIDMAIKEAS